MAKKILILNWRDPQSPLEGGAERFTRKFAEYWAQKKHHVTWITNSFPGSAQVETIKGVTYIRVGPVLTGSLLNYLWAYPLFFIRAVLSARSFVHQKKADIVIDEIHGLPFFTPLISSTRNILLACEVAGEIWYKMFPFPISWIGDTLERKIYSLYQSTEIWAISENTKNNIHAIIPNAQVKQIDLGVELGENKPKILKKHSHPSAVFLARLVPMKGIESALKAVPKILTQLPTFKLYVMGSGNADYVEQLKQKAHALGIQDAVLFLGHIDGKKKYQVLSSSHFLIHPSYKEGFGLTVIEASLVGTPAIVRAGSSLDALVKDGYNGFRFSEDSEIADIFTKQFRSKKYSAIQKNSFQFAERYTWPQVLKRLTKTTGI